MNIDILKNYLSEEDFTSLSEKLEKWDMILSEKSDETDTEALLNEISSLKQRMDAREKIGIALADKAPVDFSLALSLIDEMSVSEENSAESLVNSLKEKHPSLFKDYFKKEIPVTTSFPHTGHLTDRENMSDKDYYDSILKNRK